jgi:hypothetical protein
MSQENGRKRRRFTAEDKAPIVRRHLADKVPVSDLCDEYHIQPSLLMSGPGLPYTRRPLAHERRVHFHRVRQSDIEHRQPLTLYRWKGRPRLHRSCKALKQRSHLRRAMPLFQC